MALTRTSRNKNRKNRKNIKSKKHSRSKRQSNIIRYRKTRKLPRQHGGGTGTLRSSISKIFNPWAKKTVPAAQQVVLPKDPMEEYPAAINEKMKRINLDINHNINIFNRMTKQYSNRPELSINDVIGYYKTEAEKQEGNERLLNIENNPHFRGYFETFIIGITLLYFEKNHSDAYKTYNLSAIYPSKMPSIVRYIHYKLQNENKPLNLWNIDEVVQDPMFWKYLEKINSEAEFYSQKEYLENLFNNNPKILEYIQENKQLSYLHLIMIYKTLLKEIKTKWEQKGLGGFDKGKLQLFFKPVDEMNLDESERVSLIVNTIKQKIPVFLEMYQQIHKRFVKDMTRELLSEIFTNDRVKDDVKYLEEFENYLKINKNKLSKENLNTTVSFLSDADKPNIKSSN
jgi:hypothetical protein